MKSVHTSPIPQDLTSGPASCLDITPKMGVIQTCIISSAIHSTHVIGLAALLLAVGCASTSSLPSGAKKVGGGLQIDWDPPADGTAILIETTTGKTVATKSVAERPGFGFSFDPSSQRDADALKAIFPTMPSNAQFVLYFVPSPKKR